MSSDPYPRDLVGYGEHPPDQGWPDGKRLAVSFVLNYEEGGEHTLLNGDATSEIFLHEVPSSEPLFGLRNVNTESAYDYGARAGVWRVLRAFDDYQMPLTVYAVTRALELNPAVGAAFAERGHEVASHHHRWIDYLGMGEEEERRQIARSVEIIEEQTGQKPVGWYGGRISQRTRQLVFSEWDNFLYDSDVYDDDLPHWIDVDGKPILLIPYAFDTNDMKYFVAPGFGNGDAFEAYLRDAFDLLRAESETTPKMMSIGLHCRISGRPGRAAALRRFLDYVSGFDDVWVCRRADIARHYHARDVRR